MVTLLLSGCGTMGGYVTDYCLVAKPIYASSGDTHETLRQILIHNETYVRLCNE